MVNLKPSSFNFVYKESGKNYIVNTFSCAICEVDDYELAAIQSGELGLLGQDSLEEMQREGILIHSEADEIGVLRHAYAKCRSSKENARITICTTLECNFACPYCYEKRIKGYMSREVQDAVIEHIRGLINEGIKSVSVVWYGGEPLLYPEIISRVSNEIINICEENNVGYSCSIITNGFLINERTLDLFKEIGLSAVQITIDGDEKTHNQRRCLINGQGTYSQIIQNISLLSTTNISITVRVNVDKSNIEAFSHVQETIHQICPNARCLTGFVTEEVTQKEEQKSRCYSHAEKQDYYNLLREKRSLPAGFDQLLKHRSLICCAEHYYSTVIDPFGYRYQCVNEVGKPEYSIASLIHNQVNAENAIGKYFGRDPFTEAECKDCKYIPLCLGGCLWEFKDKGSHSCAAIRYCLTDIIKSAIKKST